MTVCVVGLARGKPRAKVLGKTPWRSKVTQPRSVQLLVGWDDETGNLIVIPYDGQFSPSDFPVVSLNMVEDLDLEQVVQDPRVVRKNNKCSRSILNVDDGYVARGATLAPVSKPDSSFLTGKAPSKIPRKEGVKRRS